MKLKLLKICMSKTQTLTAIIFSKGNDTDMWQNTQPLGAKSYVSTPKEDKVRTDKYGLLVLLSRKLFSMRI